MLFLCPPLLLRATRFARLFEVVNSGARLAKLKYELTAQHVSSGRIDADQISMYRVLNPSKFISTDLGSVGLLLY